MQIQAAVLRHPDKPFVLEDVELDDPGPGEVLVRIAGAGLCHTDLMYRSLPELPMPMILGHEGSGVVEAAGPGVRRFAPGDHVVMSYDSCGHCPQCLAAAPCYCDEFIGRNFSGMRQDFSSAARDTAGSPVAARWFGQSSFATHALATERNLVAVDTSLPIETLGPLGCGVQTGAGSVLLALGVRPASTIAIFGTGAVGLSAVMAARVAGASEIIAVDLHTSRRDLALELGATRALDGADPDLAAALGQADYVLDTTGVPGVIATAVRALRPGGSCGLLGVGGGPITLEPEGFAGRSIRYIFEGEAVPQAFIPTLIRLWRQGRFPFDRLIKTYPLSQANEAERDSASGGCVKPVLLPET